MEKEFLIAQAFCFHSSDGDKSWTANKHFTGMCLCNFSAACQRCERRLRQSFVLESHCVTHKMFTLEVACESWKFPKQWLSKKSCHTRGRFKRIFRKTQTHRWAMIFMSFPRRTARKRIRRNATERFIERRMSKSVAGRRQKGCRNVNRMKLASNVRYWISNDDFSSWCVQRVPPGLDARSRNIKF